MPQAELLKESALVTFNLAYRSRLESLEEHLITFIAGVLRLRATSRPLCDRSARRFAQDDGFVGLKNLRLAAHKTRKARRLAWSVLIFDAGREFAQNKFLKDAVGYIGAEVYSESTEHQSHAAIRLR